MPSEYTRELNARRQAKFSQRQAAGLSIIQKWTPRCLRRL